MDEWRWSIGCDSARKNVVHTQHSYNKDTLSNSMCRIVLEDYKLPIEKQPLGQKYYIILAKINRFFSVRIRNRRDTTPFWNELDMENRVYGMFSR
jgi:hypothetical protein